MENNLNKDGLEDFLRKSFEKYDDSPSDNLWDKIEADLGEAPKSPSRIVGVWKNWSLAAAAVLIGLIISQHIFYSQKIIQLAGQLEQHTLALKKLDDQLKTNEAAALIEQASPSIEQPITSNINNTLTSTKPTATEKHLATTSNSSNVNTVSSVANNDAIKEPVPTSSMGDQMVQQISSPPYPTRELIKNFIFLEQPVLQAIPFANIEKKPTLINAVKTPAINPVSTSNKWSIGIHSRHMWTQAKISRLMFLPPPNTPGHRSIFNNLPTKQGETKWVGLTASKDLTSNWFVQSGLYFKEANCSSNIKIRFKFKDFDEHAGGSGQQHDVEYSLYTAGGSVEMELRADQTDPNEIIDEEEDINLRIETAHQIRQLSIPVEVGYKMGNGRLQFQSTGGLIVNFLLDNDFEIAGAALDNDKLMIQHTNRSNKSGPQLRKTTLDYTVGAGIAYHLSPRVELHATPTLIGSISNRHNDLLFKSSELSAGMDIGMNYRF